MFVIFPMVQAKRENLLVNLLINVVIPSFILMRASGPESLGPVWALVVALSFPLCYGIWDVVVRRSFNMIAFLGLLSVILTGGIGLLQLPNTVLAWKEALVPFVFAVVVFVSLWTPYPVLESLLKNAFDFQYLRSKVSRKDQKTLQMVLRRSTYLLVASFLLSAVLNFVLASWIVVSEPGTVAYTEELGRLTLLSYPVIALPSMVVTICMVWYLLRGLRRLTGLPVEELLR